MTKAEARQLLRRSLGNGYSRRLGAMYAVFYDGEGALKRFGASDDAIAELAEILRRIRDTAELNF